MKKISLIPAGLLGLSMFLAIVSWTTEAQGIVWNTNPIPLPLATAYHGSVVYNDKMYVIGGMVSSGLPTGEVYYAEVNPDGTVAAFTTTTPLPEPRYYHAVSVWNNYIYVVGGHAGGPSPGERNSVWHAEINLDGTLGSWMPTSSLPWSSRNHFAVVWDRWIYVGGGTSGSGWRDEVAYAEINPDGSLGSWTYTTSLPLEYGGMGALASNGNIYVIGGTSTWGGLGLSHNEVYYASLNPDGSIGSWSASTPLPDRRECLGVSLINDNIYVTGGIKTPEITIHDTVYKADVNPDGTVGSWQTLPSLPEPRVYHTSVAYGNRIYVIGGWFDDFKDTIYYSSIPVVSATIDIDPDTLNLKSNGQWITAYITLPEGYNVEDIVLEAVQVEGFPAAWSEIQYDVYMVKFDRAAVQSYLTEESDYESAPKSYQLTLTVTGELIDGTHFEGSDTITVLKK